MMADAGSKSSTEQPSESQTTQSQQSQQSQQESNSVVANQNEPAMRAGDATEMEAQQEPTATTESSAEESQVVDQSDTQPSPNSVAGGQQQAPSASTAANSNYTNQSEGTSESQSDVATPEEMQAAGPSMNESENRSNPAEPSDSAAQPGDNMSRRMLDLAQSSSSQQMVITIDEWAGSFQGQQMEKVAIAIAPIFDELDSRLKQAETLTRDLLSHVENAGAWQSDQTRRTGDSMRLVEECEAIIAKTESKTCGDTLCGRRAAIGGYRPGAPGTGAGSTLDDTSVSRCTVVAASSRTTRDRPGA